MGYILFAFIGREPELQTISSKFGNAKIILLEQGIGIIPMTEELYDEINDLAISTNIEPFTYLNFDIEQKILQVINNGMLAYVEAEYFGGQGGQSAILWRDGAIETLFPHDKGAINKVLKSLGVFVAGGMDEFDTLGFGRNRNMEDWLDM